jgi:hypothetical protein
MRRLERKDAFPELINLHVPVRACESETIPVPG